MLRIAAAGGLSEELGHGRVGLGSDDGFGTLGGVLVPRDTDGRAPVFVITDASAGGFPVLTNLLLPGGGKDGRVLGAEAGAGRGCPVEIGGRRSEAGMDVGAGGFQSGCQRDRRRCGDGGQGECQRAENDAEQRFFHAYSLSLG